MGLVGSLEDLGLGEILQIVGLSGKSGVLSIRSGKDEGRIVFADGRIRGARLRGSPEDLRSLLAARGALARHKLEALVQEAGQAERPLEQLVLERGVLDAEALEGLRRDSAEAAVREMFGWAAGEFLFETGDDLQAGAEELLLAVGLNAQFLALECARRSDEDEAGMGDEASRLSGTEPAIPVSEAAPDAAAPASEADPETRPPVVVIDRSLPVLEWVKKTLAGHFPRIHIFQRSELGIARVRQYLVRSELPLVILAEDAPPDPLSGAQTGAAIAARLRSQAPRMPLVMLRDTADGEGGDAPGGAALAVLGKPGAALFGDRRASARRQELADALREALLSL